MAEGLPIAAVSTATALFPAPTYAIMVDAPNPRKHPRGHGEDIEDKLRRSDVIPVTCDSFAKRFNPYPNTVAFKTYTPHNVIDDRRPFHDGDGVAWVLNRSMPCAVQWLAKKFDCLIFCGCDLAEDKGHVGGISGHHFDGRKKGMLREVSLLRAWYKIITDRGDTWLSWTPDPSPLNEFMAPYEPGRFASTSKK